MRLSNNAFFPHPQSDLLQMFDRVEELICEQSLADMVFFTENDGKLRLDAAAI